MEGKARPSLQDTQEQFGRQAQRYAVSGLHRHGESLETVLRLAAVQPTEGALDVGTGTGFTAFALAPLARLVIGVDATREMLAEARALAREMDPGARAQWAVAAAEHLPLTSGSLDLITCRFATHHFHNLPLALKELARALKPGGRAVICDVVAPEPPALVKLMNALEKKRDPTHVWNYPLSQWQEEMLPAAGLRPQKVVRGKNPQLFSEWVQRAGTPPEAVQELTEMFSSAGEEARRAFQVRWDGAELLFAWDNAVILATRAE